MSKIAMLGTKVIFQRNLIPRPVSPEKYSIKSKGMQSDG